MSEEYKVIVTNTDEEIKGEELKRLIDEALSKTETIEEILKAKGKTIVIIRAKIITRGV